MTITYSITAQVVTPESAESGEAAYEGVVVLWTPTTLRDLLGELRTRGVASLERMGNGFRVHHVGSTDPCTGAQTTATTHVVCPPSLPARLRRLTTLAIPVGA